MHNHLFIALLAGLGGMLGWGFADFCAKKTIDKVGALQSLVWGHGFGAALFILAVILKRLGGGSVPAPSGWAWLGLIFFGVLQMVVYWLVYIGFGKGQLAVLNPVFAAFPGIVAVFSIIFFHEKLTFLLATALIATFVGIILLNADIEALRAKKLHIKPGLKEVTLAAVLAAGWTLGWDRLVRHHDPLTYAALMYVFMTLAALIAALVTKTRLRGVAKGISPYLFLIGLGETVAYLAITWGYSRTSLVSVVAIVSGSFSLPTIILAYLFLKERITKLQAAATVLTIAGIGLIALAR